MNFEYTKILYLLFILIPVFFVLNHSNNLSVTFASVYKGKSPSNSYFFLKYLFAFMFIGSMVAIAARPYVESNRSGDYLILVDVSRSMDARQSCGDLSFLDRSKVVMRRILKDVPEGRFGVFIFDRFAFPVTQMTSNLEYLNDVINDGIHIGMTFEATKTELANSLEVIADKKVRLPEIYGNVKTVVLLSDGYVSGAYRRRFSEPLAKLRNAEIKINVVGVGNTSETPIISFERGICTNQHFELDGETVFVQLRDDVLKFIASESQGKYYAEGDIENLVIDLNQSLELLEDGNTGDYYRRDMSIWFLIFGSIGLFGFLILSTDLKIKFSS